ncbi:MAG: hypothetical protein F6K19_17935 [Cyanothece sp. SIO1E1]|nr:hypothetical protein [Cyanothece sp. SIO1E1]
MTYKTYSSYMCSSNCWIAIPKAAFYREANLEVTPKINLPHNNFNDLQQQDGELANNCNENPAGATMGYYPHCCRLEV